MNLATVRTVLLNAIQDHKTPESDRLLFSELSVYLRLKQVLLESTQENIRKIFQKRFRLIFLTASDLQHERYVDVYYWVPLARMFANLSTLANHNLYYFLYPSSANQIDFNSFQPLRSIASYHNVFLSDDRAVVYDVRGLLNHIVRHGGRLALYRNPNQFSQAVISIDEMTQILACKFDMQAYEIGSDKFISIRDVFEHKIFPKLSTQGELQPRTLRALLEVIQQYLQFEDKGKAWPIFQEHFRRWLAHLYHEEVEDVGYLYAVTLQQGDKPVRMVDLFIELNRLNGLANPQLIMTLTQWILSVYPNLAIHDSCFAELHKKLKIAEAFDLTVLTNLIMELNCGADQVLERAKAKILANSAKDLNTFVKLMPNLYRLRWQKIMRTELDYTRCQTGVNGPWIRLAQILHSTGLLEMDYFRLLMPTNLTDQISNLIELTQVPLSVGPLSHYITGDNGRLIYLPACVQQFKTTHSFVYWEGTHCITLSAKEMQLVDLASVRFQRFTHVIERESKIPALSLAVVLKMREFASRMFNKRGLIAVRELTEDQYERSSAAYLDLMYYLHHMSPDELNALRAQRMQVHGNPKKFEELINDLRHDNEDRGCISVASLYLIYLVKSYVPYLRFSPHIEQHECVVQISQTVPQLMLSDEAEYTEAEARIFCLAILQSLLALQARLGYLSGKQWDLWDKRFNLPAPGIEVAELIRQQLTCAKPNFRRCYMIVREVVLTPLAGHPSKNLSYGITRLFYNDNQLVATWARRCLEDKFETFSNNWFTPEAILWGLFVGFNSNDLKDTYFVDELLKIFMQNTSRDLIEWRINLWLQEFLIKQTPSKRNNILASCQGYKDRTMLLACLQQYFTARNISFNCQPITTSTLFEILKLMLAGSDYLRFLERRIPDWKEIYEQREARTGLGPSYLS